MKIKAETERYEKSNENFIHSLSRIYAGGITGKVKYEQGKSALVMKHTDKTTKKGNPSKQRITFTTMAVRPVFHSQYRFWDSC